MALLWRKSSAATRKRVTTEWLMSPSDINVWRSKISMEHKDGSTLKKLLEYLHDKGLHIGPNSMRGGFLQCLHQACLVDSFRFVGHFLKDYREHGIDLNELHPTHFFPTPDESSASDKARHRRETLVHAATIGNSINIVKLLLSLDVSAVNIRNCCSKVPLIVALEERNEEIVSILLDHRADVNCCDNEGVTVLMYAVRIPVMINFIPQIIHLGADLRATDCRGYTALHIAIAEGTPKATHSLFQHDHSISCDSTHLLVDRSNFVQQDFVHEIHIKDFHDLLTSESRKQFPIKCCIDLLLLKASWYFTCHIIKFRKIHDPSLVHCKHALYEAFTKDTVTPTELMDAYDGHKEMLSLNDVKKTYSELSGMDLHVSLCYQSLLVRERCLGYGDPSLIYCLLWYGEWLIEQQLDEVIMFSKEGLHLWLRGTEMLLHCIRCSNSIPSYLLNVVITALHTLMLTHEKVTSSGKYRVVLFSEDVCHRILTPIIENVIKCVSLCVALTKNRHTHLITRKSFLSGVQSLLELLNGFIEIKPEGLNIDHFVQLLVEECPKTIIDANGLPSTLAHILLQLDSVKYPEKLLYFIFENNGQWMVNGIGPLGIRPLQLTHREEVITLLIEYGAHLDSVNAYNMSVIKDLHIRRPDLFPDLTFDSSPLALKCLSASVIASCQKLPYTQLCIPPGLKRFISLHDHRAHEALLKGELEFVFTA